MAPLVFCLKGGSTVHHEEWAEAYLNLMQEDETEEEWAYQYLDWMADNGVEGVPDAVLARLDHLFFGDLIAEDEAAAAAVAHSHEPAPKRLCSRNDSTISVRVCHMRGAAFEVRVCRMSTVLSLKHAVEARSQVPVEHQALYFEGRLLVDGDFLSGVGIDDLSTLRLVLRLRGGSAA
jgi:hypothetical protein